jgi:hypothetical protein
VVVSDSAALLSVEHAVAEHNGRWQTVLGEQKLLYHSTGGMRMCVCARNHVCFVVCMLLIRGGNSIFVARLAFLKPCMVLLVCCP